MQIQLDLEKKPSEANDKMIATLERSVEQERNQDTAKAKLNKAMKRSPLSNTLSSFVNQGSNRKGGIGFHSGYLAYNHFIKYVSIRDNFLCFYYGKNV